MNGKYYSHFDGVANTTEGVEMEQKSLNSCRENAERGFGVFIVHVRRLVYDAPMSMTMHSLLWVRRRPNQICLRHSCVELFLKQWNACYTSTCCLLLRRPFWLSRRIAYCSRSDAAIVHWVRCGSSFWVREKQSPWRYWLCNAVYCSQSLVAVGAAFLDFAICCRFARGTFRMRFLIFDTSSTTQR